MKNRRIYHVRAEISVVTVNLSRPQAEPVKMMTGHHVTLTMMMRKKLSTETVPLWMATLVEVTMTHPSLKTTAILMLEEPQCRYHPIL